MTLHRLASLAALSCALLAPMYAGAPAQVPEPNFKMVAISEEIASDQLPDIDAIRNEGAERFIKNDGYDRLEGYVLVPKADLKSALHLKLSNFRNGKNLVSNYTALHLDDIKDYTEEVGVTNGNNLEVIGLSVDFGGSSLEVELDPVFTIPGSRVWLSSNSKAFLELVPVVKVGSAETNDKRRYMVIGYDVNLDDPLQPPKVVYTTYASAFLKLAL